MSRRPGNWAAALWLLRSTADLLPPLLLACVLACLSRFAALGIYLLAAAGLAKLGGLHALPGLEALPFSALVLLIVLLGLAKGVLRYGEQYVGHRVAFLALARLRTRVYAAAERQAPFDARRRDSGGLLALATRDVDQVEVFFAHTLPPAAAAVVVSGAVAWFSAEMFGAAPALVLLAGYLLVGLVIPALGVPGLRRAAATAARVRGVQNQQVAEALAGIDVVHGYSSGAQLLARFAATGRPAREAARTTGAITGLRAALTQLAVWGTALALVILLLPQGRPGALLVLAVIAVPSFEAVRAVDGFVLALQDSLASARRLHAAVLEPPVVPDPEHPQPLPAAGTLEVSGLGVRYGDQEVLRDVAFGLAPGELLALVGESGSGKSTAAAALVRAVPCTGTLSLGGVPLERAAAAQLRSRLLLVSQDAVMVRGSVRENLLLGDEDPGDERLAGLLGELGLGAWLAALPRGLDTDLGGRAARLSGGQRQRLALARALLRDPAVLILDESTSALDAASERLVLAALQARRARGMAVLMISHKIAILTGADRVVVLREGKVAETGTPAGLLADPRSLFARMAVREADTILPLAED